MTELRVRMEEVEKLKDRMEAMGLSIAKAVRDRTFSLNYDTHPFPSGNVY